MLLPEGNTSGSTGASSIYLNVMPSYLAPNVIKSEKLTSGPKMIFRFSKYRCRKHKPAPECRDIKQSVVLDVKTVKLIIEV